MEVARCRRVGGEGEGVSSEYGTGVMGGRWLESAGKKGGGVGGIKGD